MSDQQNVRCEEYREVLKAEYPGLRSGDPCPACGVGVGFHRSQPAGAGASTALGAAEVSAMVQQEVKRLRHEMSSKMGSITEAEHVHELERTNRISFDVIFDEELKKWAKEGDFWVCSCDSPSAGFPPIKVGEKSVVQPYFTDILKQFNTFKTDRVTGNLLRTVYRKNPRTGRYTDKIYLEESAVQSVPLLDTENTPTLGSRKPDIPCYYLSVNQLSLLRMVTFVECKPRSATTGMPAFSPAEVGQVICTAELLLDKQPQRAFAIVGLSDGVRFQFFRVGRDGGTSKVLVSCMFMNMDGWAVMFGMLLQKPDQLGFRYFELADDWQLRSFIGQGAHSTVYSIEKTDGAQYALKLFSAADVRDSELAMLRKVSEVVGYRGTVPVVDERAALAVREVMTDTKYFGIVTLPLCVPIRPQRCGVMLTHQNVEELVLTLQTLHAIGIYNGDIKPKNVLVHQLPVPRAVICDWGLGACNDVAHRSVVCRRGGSVGFDDFSLKMAQAPSAANDLQALVRTVYANFTDQVVPSSSQSKADTFWTEHWRVGSIWQAANNAAKAGDHANVLTVLLKL